MVFDLLNIEASFYDIEVGFDTATSQRYARTRFKVAVKVIFEFEYGRHVVSFEKGDTITLWRCWQYTPGQLTDLLTSVGFYTLHASQSADRNYILTISEVKCD
jgi:hypothetical protein